MKIGRNHILLCISGLCALFLTAFLFASEPVRMWRTGTGEEFEAEWDRSADVGSDRIRLVRDGEEFTIEISALSEADRAYLTQHQAAESADSPAPGSSPASESRSAAGDLREWTCSGVSVFGAWDPSRDTASDRITLESSDGSSRTLFLNDLSKEDRAYVETKRKETGWEPKPAAVAAGKPAEKYALLVGVDEYEDSRSLGKLRYTVQDVEIIRDELLSIGFKKDNIFTLKSGSGVSGKPTKRLIESKLDQLFDLAGPDDMLFLAFTGHGTQIDDTIYFCAEDTYVTDKESARNTSVSISSVIRRFERSPARFKWLVIDACRNDPFSRSAEIPGSRSIQKIDDPPRGSAVMLSCGTDEKSYEDEDLGHGLFSYYFVEGLKGSADVDGSGEVTLYELAEYTSRATKDRAEEKFHASQRPYMTGEMSSFIIADGLLKDGLSREVWAEADGYYREACLLRRQRQYRDAHGKIQEALKLTEGASEGSAERQKYLDEEEEIDQRLEMEAFRLYGEAVALVSQGNFDGALAKIEEALSLVPGKQEYQDYKARISSLKEAHGYYESAGQAYESGDYDKASALIEKALSIDSVNASYLLLKRLIAAGPKSAPGPASSAGKLGFGTRAGEKKTLTVKGIDYTFCWCPAGEFEMGSPESEEGRDDDERQHRVRLTKGFWLLESEVTQGQWESVMGTTVSEQRDKGNKDWSFRGVGSDYPMYYVSWAESVDFCRKLSELTGEKIQLPTEAQWEYACRAGSQTSLYNGEIKILGVNNAPLLDAISWYGGNSGEGYSGGEVNEGADSNGWKEKQYSSSPSGSHRVKGKKPNAWGLYDMIGNVWEWCSDWYEKSYYTDSPVTDPTGPDSGSNRVLRGGSWFSIAGNCRSASRSYDSPENRFDILGLRPAAVLAD